MERGDFPVQHCARMAPIETASAPETNVSTIVADVRRQKMQRASTVGDYVRGLQEAARQTPQQGEVVDQLATINAETREEIANQLQEQAAEVDSATEGNQDLRIDHALSGQSVQGNAMVGGGREAININPDAVERVAEKGNADSFRNLAAHENAHATKQKMMGDIQTSKGVVSNWELHEWHSEKEGAKAEGKNAASFHRAGQPADYAEAQKQGNALRRLGISEPELDGFIAQGDTAGLQKRVIEVELERGILTPAQMVDNVERDREIYAAAAYDVLTAA